MNTMIEPSARPSAGGRVPEDTLARAVLTFCLDGADALMYATIKGARGAAETLRLVIGGRGP